MTNFSVSVGSSTPRKKPQQLEGGCGCLFSALFFLAGSGFFALMIGAIVWPEWRANHSYIEHACVVLDKRVGVSDGKSVTYRPEIHIRYAVEGKEFQTWTYDVTGAYWSGRSGKQEIIDQFTVGQTYPCWYDPNDPSKAVVVLGYSWFAYLILLLPLLFMAVGGGGMYYCWSRRGKSDEELAAPSLHSAAYPTVPDKNLSAKPGATLQYRLPLTIPPGCEFLVLLGIALFWNGVTSIFVTQAVQSHLQGQPNWFLSVFILPFVAIGLVLIVACVRQLLIALRFSRAQVEIDAFPLSAGQSTRIQVIQPGPLRLKSLEVLLVCEESASYEPTGNRRRGHGGSSRRTETVRVHQDTLAEQTDLELSRDMPWEFKGKITIPPGAMHSFEAANNKIVWKLLVKGEVQRWPDFEWEFPLVVRPAEAGGKS